MALFVKINVGQDQLNHFNETIPFKYESTDSVLQN